MDINKSHGDPMRILKSLQFIAGMICALVNVSHAGQITNDVKAGGTDPVAHFTQTTSVIGLPEFTTELPADKL